MIHAKYEKLYMFVPTIIFVCSGIEMVSMVRTTKRCTMITTIIPHRAYLV